MLYKQVGPFASPKLRGLSMLNNGAMVVVSDGSKLRILTPTLEVASEFPVDGEIEALLIVGSMIFVGFKAAIPGLMAASSPVSHLRAILVRAGAEPVVWTLTAPNVPWAHRLTINALDAAHVSDDAAPVLFSCSDDGLIRMWQHNPGPNVWVCTTLEGHARSVKSVAWVHSAQRVYSGSEDGTIKVWSPSGACTGTVLPPTGAGAGGGARGGFLAAVAGGPAAPAADGPSHSAPVTALVEMTFAGGTFLLSGASDGSIKAWVLTVPDAPQAVPAVAVPPDDKGQRLITSMMCAELESAPGNPVLVTGHLGGSLTIRDVSNNLAPIATIQAVAKGDGRGGGHTDAVRVLTQGPGDSFYSGADDGSLAMWQCVFPAAAAAGP